MVDIEAHGHASLQRPSPMTITAGCIYNIIAACFVKIFRGDRNDLVQKKYRIESTRLKNWDYSANGYYFITICTHGRACLFGKIMNGNMILSDIGKIVLREWNESFNIRSELFCDCFVIMPNHIHAVVVIKNTHDVEAHCRVSLQQQCKKPVAVRRPKSVSSFVAGFKSSATKQINMFRKTPGMALWQLRFHDHIIRNVNELQRIRQYILNNPVKWQDDKFYSGGNAP